MELVISKKIVITIIHKLNIEFDKYNSEPNQINRDTIITTLNWLTLAIGNYYQTHAIVGDKKTNGFPLECKISSGDFLQPMKNPFCLLELLYEIKTPLQGPILDDDKFIIAFYNFLWKVWQRAGHMTLNLYFYVERFVNLINHITRPHYAINNCNLKNDNYLVESKMTTAQYTCGRGFQANLKGECQSRLFVFNSESASDDSMDLIYYENIKNKICPVPKIFQSVERKI